MNTAKLLLLSVFCLFFGGAMLVATTFVIAEESDQVYGKGVHAFFDRDYEGAVTILLQIEDIKSDDPRPYYFLGLAYLRQKKTEEADQCFKKAAQLEYSGRALRDYAVSESLRRIQGEERLRIEKIRSDELTNARVREQQLREARYGSENAADRNAIRQLGQQSRKEDLALLREMAGATGDNAFGVKPMDPNATSDETVAARRVDSAPFGGVSASASEAPTILVQTAPVVSPPVTPVRTGGRTFVNPDVSVVQEETRTGEQPGTAPSLAGGAREVAQGIGNGLLFSGAPLAFQIFSGRMRGLFSVLPFPIEKNYVDRY